MMRKWTVRIGATLWCALHLFGCANGSPAGLSDDNACPMNDPGFPPVAAPEPGAEDRIVALKKKAWEAARGGEEAARPHIQRRLAGWPTAVLVDRTTLPHSDREFLTRLARDTWRGLDALRDRENGLPLDTVRLGQNSTALAHAWIGDYTNVSTIGLHMIATAAAADIGLVTRSDGIDRLQRLLQTVERLEGSNGFLFNFYDTTSEERTSNFISFVDSSWLTAGLIVARSAFPELYATCTRLISGANYGIFFDASAGQMSHGYFVHRSARSRYHYGMLYAESRLGSLIAIGKGDVPATHWFHMIRTFPSACTWQSRPPLDRHVKTALGQRFPGGYYEWKDVRYVPSWGGSMFEALMPTLVLDEVQHAPYSLGANDRAHATVQRRYALEELNAPVWGMSPCATTTHDSYAEFGVPPLGAAGYPPGVVTPHAAALALPVTPDEAIANLRRMVESYDIYGEYGLYDAVDPRTGAVAHTYLGLDQAMIFIALANHLHDGCVQKHFAADPIVQHALPVLGLEHFFQ